MTNPKDTIKVQLVSDEYKVSKNIDNVIVIEQKEKDKEPSSLLDNPLISILLLPLFVAVLTAFITARITTRSQKRKEKAEIDKTNQEVENLKKENAKVNEEISQMKISFQPIVLSSLQKIQDSLLEKKLKALDRIVLFDLKLYDIDEIYIDGERETESKKAYFDLVYQQKINSEVHKLYENFSINYANVFSNEIRNKIWDIREDLRTIADIQTREYSKTPKNQNMPEDAYNKLLGLKEKIRSTIDLIRNDLFLDETFIRDFINKYKN